MPAAIFDMDGLLIDSEPHWRDAEVNVFGALGVPLTHDMCMQTMGMRIDEVVAYWYQRYPWPGPDRLQVRERVLGAVAVRLRSVAEALPGAVLLVQRLVARGVPVAVASSSPRALIDAGLERVGLTSEFSVRCSAMDEARGKPDPGVFLSAARGLGVVPSDCVVFEDSVAGVAGARAAGMRVVAVPAPAQQDHPGFVDADLRLTSLAQCDLRLFKL